MITNIKKVAYTIVELTKDDLIRLLLGDTIEEEANRVDDQSVPALFRGYCSSPCSMTQLINHLTLTEKAYEKKEKSCCTPEGRH